MKQKPVWVWLPDEAEPTLAGVLDTDGHHQGRFTYQREYMGLAKGLPLDPMALRFDRRSRGIPVFAFEGVPGVIRDACPSGYGAELISRQHDAQGDLTRSGGQLPTLDLLELGADDAVGALAACDNIERKMARPRPSFIDLSAAILALDDTQSPSRAIRALSDDGGTSAGGERPKITVEHEGRLWLAKMQDRHDVPFLPSKEYVCMTLAGRCGLDVPEVRLELVANTHVFMAERFDRHGHPAKPYRRLFASARTVLGLAPDAVKGDPRRSYLAFGDGLSRWARHAEHRDIDLREIWRRMSFNALVGNLDDHPLNHGLYHLAGEWRLSPAFDITPLKGFAGFLSLATGPDGSLAATPERLLAVAGYFRFDVEDARRWLVASAGLVAGHWEGLMRQHGVTAPEVDRVRPAFATAQSIALDPDHLHTAAALAAASLGRRRSSLARVRR